MTVSTTKIIELQNYNGRNKTTLHRRHEKATAGERGRKGWGWEVYNRNFMGNTTIVFLLSRKDSTRNLRSISQKSWNHEATFSVMKNPSPVSVMF